MRAKNTIMIKKRLVKIIAPVIGHFISLRLPSIIAIEATNRCFLDCVTCPIPNHMKRQKGDMQLSTFRTFLSQINWKVHKLSWAFGGEPLLNKNIWQMIKLAALKGIPSKVDTNGMLLNKYENEIFNSNLRVLNIAFEGLSKENTSSFRQGFDHELVISNIKAISRRKNAIGAEYPVIILNYLVRKDNEDDIERTIELARGWKIDDIIFKSINISPSLWLSQSQMQYLGNKFLPVKRAELSRYKRQNGQWVPKENLSDYCRYLINSLTVTWEGKVLPCCFDFDASMVVGDIHNEDLKSIWRNERFSLIRKKVYSGSIQMCNNCTSVSLQKKVNIIKNES
ncbi:MAG TPA: hypothetical protein DCY56_04870 [Candidatus Omnitrophica bacterium]|nr:hypothetical protein [Candidatus Omnitrophota bacterium]